MDQNLDYLQPGFDPSTLKVAELRNLLNKHDIEYPTAGKKADLVRAFRERLTPISSEILQQYTLVIPSSENIIDVPARGHRHRSASPSKDVEHSTATTPKSVKSPAKRATSASSRKNLADHPPSLKHHQTPTPASSHKTTEPSSRPSTAKKRTTRHVKSSTESADDLNDETDLASPSRIPLSTKRTTPSSKNAATSSTPQLSPFKKHDTSLSATPVRKSPLKSTYTEILADDDDDIFVSGTRHGTPTPSSHHSPRKTPKTHSRTVTPKHHRAEKPVEEIEIEEVESVFVKDDAVITSKSVAVTSTVNGDEAISVDEEDEEEEGVISVDEELEQKKTPVKPVKKTSSTPFTKNNVFQSGSNPATPLPHGKRKRPIDDDGEASAAPNKKRESIVPGKDEADDVDMNDTEPSANVTTIPEAQEEAEDGTEEPTEHLQAPETPLPGSSTSKFVTPENRPPNRAPPPTAPPLRSSGYKEDGPSLASPTHPYSTRKSSLPKDGRRISFMPSLNKLRVSDIFKESSSPDSPQIRFQPTTPATQRPAPPATPFELAKTPSRFDVEGVASDEEEEETALEKLRDELNAEEEPAQPTENEEDVRQGGSILKALGVSVLFVIFAAFSRWYIDAQFEAGYCNVDFDTNKPAWVNHIRPHYSGPPQRWQEYFDQEYIADRVDEALDKIRPECAPCPEHAVCFSEFKSVCEDGFVQIASPWSFGGFLPVPPKCVPDTEKQKRIEKLTKKALEILRDRNAKFICGSDDTETSEYEEAELRNVLYSMKADSITDEEFDDLWRHAIEGIEGDEEVIIRQTSIVDEETHAQDDEPVVRGEAEGDEEEPELSVLRSATVVTKRRYLSTESLASITFGCALKRSITGVLERYRAHIGLILTLVVGIYGGKEWRRIRDERLRHAEELATTAIDRLKQQLVAYREDERGRTLPCVAVGHLRDELQPNVKDLKARKRVWADVEKIVENNSNVRSKQTDIRGEIMRVWEWVGADL